MATTIRIKRSGVAGNPSTLAQGELAYSYFNGSGGDRLYVGTGTEIAGDAVNHEVIGGKYYVDLLGGEGIAPFGTLTANTALIADSDSKLDRIIIDNVTIDGNTISTTNTNGNLILDPNGTGTINVSGAIVTNAADPVGNTDLVTLQYLNNQLSTGVTFDISDGTNTDNFNANTGTLRFIGDSETDISGIRTTVSDDQVLFELTHNSITLGNDEVKLGQTITDLNGLTALDVDFVSIDSDSITTTGGSGFLNLRQETRVHSSVSKATGDSDVSVFDVVDVAGAQLFKVAQNGDVLIGGNLTVQGTETIVNSTTVSIDDKNIVLADNAANATEANGAGLTIGGDLYSGTKATITYDGATDRWDLNKALDVTDGTNDLTSIKVAGTALDVLIEDHLVDNFFLQGLGITITDNGDRTITFSGELASKSNAGIASFDSDQFLLSGTGENLATIYQIDGGSY